MIPGGNRGVLAVVALTLIVLAADSIVSLTSGTYLNLGTGVWLALARDARDGIFYRPLWDGAAYGGTRYLPVFFLPIAGLMRLGVDAVPAGVVVSMAGLGALAASVAFLLRRLAVPAPLVALGTALAVAPYFVHQTAFAVRCEPLAVAFSLAGLGLILPLEARPISGLRLVAASVLFAAAFGTKITTVYAPVAATVALLISGHQRAAWKLPVLTAMTGGLLLVAIHLSSHGRALESFRACALAGSSAALLLSTTGVMRTLELVLSSHLLTVVFVLAAAGLIVAPWRRVRLPVLVLTAALGVTTVIFGSPGTVITSHIVDAFVAAVVVLTAVAGSQEGRVRTWGTVALSALTMWAAAQNAARLWDMTRPAEKAVTAERRELVQATRQCGPSMVAESPLIPLLGGFRPVLLDPFAFHVVAANRPEIARDLVRRLDAGEFACVVLEQDPETPRGRAWYRNVNLTEAAVDAVSRRYELDRTLAGQRIYRVRKLRQP